MNFKGLSVCNSRNMAEFLAFITIHCPHNSLGRRQFNHACSTNLRGAFFKVSKTNWVYLKKDLLKKFSHLFLLLQI